MQVEVPDIFKAFLNVLSIVGFFPLRFYNKRIYERSVYYPTFFLLTYSGMLVVMCILGQQEPDAEESLLVRYGNYSLYLQFIAMILFVVLFNYLKRKKIATCLLLMHHFDCTILQVRRME